MTDEKNAPQPAAAPENDTAADDFAATVASVEATESTPAAEAPAASTPTIDEAPGAKPGAHTAPRATDDDPDVTYESVAEAFAAVTDGPDAVDESAPSQYGVGPFSIREVALGGIWLVAFIVSFFPIYGPGSTSVWTGGIDWVLTIGVPTIAVFLVGLRRLSPQGIRRVGSLGIDQFASVAFSVATIVWLGILWASFVTLAGQRVFYASWVVWVEFIVMLAGVLLTVFAPLFPTIGDDFRHRTEVPAHRFASPARPVIARPAAERPAAYAAPTATASAPVATAEPAVDTTPVGDETHVIDTAAVADQAEPPAASQAFWALAPVERDVVDENGMPLFTVGPTAWALVIEDRGDSFVVRHEDGRIGYLRDVSGVTRG